MTIRSAGRSLARLLSTLLSTLQLGRLAQTGAENGVRFLEAVQGIGTGGTFSRRELAAIFSGLPPSGCVVFDAGAHTGQFSRAAMKRISSDGMIHAFEPAAASFRELERVFAGEPRVRLSRTALSCESGSGVLFYDEPGSQLASLTPRARFGDAKSEGVRLETIDEYCRANHVARIDLLKLDVEGHELEVLRGAGDMLRRGAIRRIVFEFGGCHIDMRVFFRDLYELLAARGMRISRLMPGGKLWPIEKYDESLERFRTTNYLATF